MASMVFRPACIQKCCLLERLQCCTMLTPRPRCSPVRHNRSRCQRWGVYIDDACVGGASCEVAVAVVELKHAVAAGGCLPAGCLPAAGPVAFCCSFCMS